MESSSADAREERKSERLGPEFRASLKVVWERRGVEGETEARRRIVVVGETGFAVVFGSTTVGGFARSRRHRFRARIASMATMVSALGPLNTSHFRGLNPTSPSEV
jgi:hypothetical protein